MSINSTITDSFPLNVPRRVKKIYQITGLKLHYRIGKHVEGPSNDFIYTDVLVPEYTLCLFDENRQRYELALIEEHGECGSGWTTASWGRHEIFTVDSFGALTHQVVPNSEESLMFEYDESMRNLITPYFSFSEVGDQDDDYYPQGYVKVNLDKFTPTERGFSTRPVWIFIGKSGLGKSFLAHQTDLNVFETDAYEILPEKITADIIVKGNKYPHTLEELKSRIVLSDQEPIMVNFGTE
jgi:hypothetical protein